MRRIWQERQSVSFFSASDADPNFFGNCPPVMREFLDRTSGAIDPSSTVAAVTKT
jgi:hypothetical protein